MTPIRLQARCAPFLDPGASCFETGHDAVLERVDAEGHIIGFSVIGISQFRKDRPLEADLIAV